MAEDVIAMSCLLIFAGGGRGAPFRMSAHPLFSWECTVKGQGDGIWWLCNLVLKMLQILVQFVLKVYFLV